MMRRKYLTKKICRKVLKHQNRIDLSKMEDYSTCHSEKYKSGLYFLFNDQHKCIYVGKVGNGQTASLYMRMIGNSNGAHKIQAWYTQIAYGYWHKFDVEDSTLETMERLAIYGMKQPIYNDKHTDQNSIDELYSKIASAL